MAGYTRQDTQNNIANGNVIDADDFDAEYNALESAFDASAGHKHDGTAGEGAPITKTGPAQEYVSDGTALYPKTDNTYDLGKSGNEWKDLYVDGTANLDSVVAGTADINGGTLDDVTVGATTPAAGTFTQVDVTARGDLRLQDTTGGEYVALQAPDTVSANVTFTLPGADGTNGQTLVTDGSGNLSFADSGSVWTESGSDIYYNSGNVGIGTTSPTADLHVSGDIILSGNYPVGSGNFFAGNNAGGSATNALDGSVIIGTIAGDSLTDGDDAVIIGQNAVGQATDCSSGTIAIGANSLYAAGTVALGDFGLGNIAVGEDTVVLLGGSASRNVFMGHEAGELLSSVGSYNVAIGAQVLGSASALTMQDDNTIMGAQACYEADEINDNVVIGRNAGYYLSSTSASRDPIDNVIIGKTAGVGPTSGAGHEKSVMVGKNALTICESSIDTVAVGYQAGVGVSNTDDAEECTFLGSMAGASSIASGGTVSNITCVGYFAEANSSSNEITLGNSSVSSLRCNVTTITSLSDERDKSNIQDIPYGLDYINAVRPVSFDWDRRDGSYEGKKDIGFIAQELDQVESEFNSSEYTSLVSKANPEKLEAAPHNLFPILVKAVQELSAEVQSLKTELAELKGS